MLLLISVRLYCSNNSEDSFLAALSSGASSQIDNQSVVKSAKKSKSLSRVSSVVHKTSQKSVDTSQVKSQKSKSQKSTKIVNDTQDSLSFISSYYGNPRYKKAMSILDDEKLQNAYSQNLQSIRMQISDYAQQMIKNHHIKVDKTTEEIEQEQKQKNIHSFLQGLQSASSSHESIVPNKTVHTKAKKKQSNASAFLASL